MPFSMVNNRPDPLSRMLLAHRTLRWLDFALIKPPQRQPPPSTGRIYPHWSMASQKIEPGTLLKCHLAHAVIDFVLVTKDEEVVFIQTSISKYIEHDSRFKDLFDETKLRVSTETNETSEKSGSFTQMSVFEYYARRAGIDIRKPNPRSLRADCYYVYITSCPTTCTTRNAEEKKHVILVGPDQLEISVGNWKDVKSAFSSDTYSDA
eukprot:m.188496 g.188496  ORF g.188496 m.188496 type:complete len:207 (+) comp16725_c0_seq4:1602-2222(+)